MADYVYHVQMDVPTELEGDFHRIYDTQHIPNLLAVPGVHSCARYRLESGDTDGVAKYLAVYEWTLQSCPTPRLGKQPLTKGIGLLRFDPSPLTVPVSYSSE